MTDKHGAPLMQAPVSLEIVFPPSDAPTIPTVSRELEVNSEGRLLLNKRTECEAYAFMLPFPFFCFGCCLNSARCVDITFDDRNQTVKVTEWYPYSCLCPKVITYEYAQIANIGFITTVSSNSSSSGGSSSSHSHYTGTSSRLYRPMLVMLDGSKYDAHNPISTLPETKDFVLKLHGFVFGRGPNASSYEVPELNLLKLPGEEGCILQILNSCC